MPSPSSGPQVLASGCPAGPEHKEVFMSCPWAVHRGGFVRGAPARRGRRLPPSPAVPTGPHHLLDRLPRPSPHTGRMQGVQSLPPLLPSPPIAFPMAAGRGEEQP